MTEITSICAMLTNYGTIRMCNLEYTFHRNIWYNTRTRKKGINDFYISQFSKLIKNKFKYWNIFFKKFKNNISLSKFKNINRWERWIILMEYWLRRNSKIYLILLSNWPRNFLSVFRSHSSRPAQNFPTNNDSNISRALYRVTIIK